MSVNGVAMSYDAAGNQINDGSGQRTYDAENRMLTATNGGVGSSYTYDADGRRVRRIVGGVETWQVYGIGGELLAEYAAGAAPSAPQKEYGYRNGQLLVVWDGSETGDRQLQWLVQDHLGSTRMVVDRSGSLGGIRRHDFAPFGEELFAGAAIRSASNGYSGDSVRQKFTGKEHDGETGLDYFLARYYSSTQGRFTSPDEFKGGPDALSVLGSGDPEKQALVYADTTNPQSLNKYQYCFNNPLSCVDPDGQAPQDGGVGSAEERDVRLLGAGKITREEFERRQQERSDPRLLIGLAVAVGIVYAPEAVSAVMLFASRNPHSVEQIAAMLQEASGGPPGVISGNIGGALKNELSIAQKLVSEGKNVEILTPSNVARTADFLVNGVKVGYSVADL
jgi:RHS repeat-associated protein